jgi:hypothetical protein
VWDAASGLCVAVVRGPADALTGIALSSDGSLLAAVGTDAQKRPQICLWDTSGVLSGGADLAMLQVPVSDSGGVCTHRTRDPVGQTGDAAPRDRPGVCAVRARAPCNLRSSQHLVRPATCRLPVAVLEL